MVKINCYLKYSLWITHVHFVFFSMKNMTRLCAYLTFYSFVNHLVLVRDREYDKKIMFFYGYRLSPVQIMSEI